MTDDDLRDILHQATHEALPSIAFIHGGQIERARIQVAIADKVIRAIRARLDMGADLIGMADALQEAHDVMHECTAVLTARDCAKVADVMEKCRAALETRPKRPVVFIERTDLEEARRSMVILQMEAEAHNKGPVPGWLLDTKASLDDLTRVLYPLPPRDSDGNPQGGDGTAPSQSDDSAAATAASP